VKLVFVTTDASWSVLERASAKIVRMVGAAELTRTTTEPAMSATVTPLGTLYLDLGASVDAGAEKVKLAKELEKLNQHIAGTEAASRTPRSRARPRRPSSKARRSSSPTSSPSAPKSSVCSRRSAEFRL
jgi:valyl-tRNA synthetase